MRLDWPNNYLHVLGPDTDIPTPRPSYAITTKATGTDVAGMTAAALASTSYLYATLANDTNYASALSTAAQSVYNLAETQPFQVYTKSVSAAAGLYQTNSFASQLVYGALWLYKATGNTTYRDKAANYYDQFKLGSVSVTPMDWSDATGAVHVLGAQLDPTKYAAGAKKWLDTMTSSSSGSPCTFTRGGMLWCNGYSNSNAMVPLQDTALLALLYSRHNPSTSEQYVKFASKQIDYMLGGNYM